MWHAEIKWEKHMSVFETRLLVLGSTHYSGREFGCAPPVVCCQHTVCHFATGEFAAHRIWLKAYRMVHVSPLTCVYAYTYVTDEYGSMLLRVRVRGPLQGSW